MFLRRVVVGVLALVVDLAAALHLSWLGINGFELVYPTARVLVDPILEGDLVFFEQPDVYSATPRETALAESARRRILESPPRSYDALLSARAGRTTRIPKPCARSRRGPS